VAQGVKICIGSLKDGDAVVSSHKGIEGLIFNHYKSRYGLPTTREKFFKSRFSLDESSGFAIA
jgi:hypothetical protein